MKAKIVCPVCCIIWKSLSLSLSLYHTHKHNYFISSTLSILYLFNPSLCYQSSLQLSLLPLHLFLLQAPLFQLYTHAVYFDQQPGAAHYVHWSSKVFHILVGFFNFSSSNVKRIVYVEKYFFEPVNLKIQKTIGRPVNIVHSAHLLVELYNTHKIKLLFFPLIWFSISI